MYCMINIRSYIMDKFIISINRFYPPTPPGGRAARPDSDVRANPWGRITKENVAFWPHKRAPTSTTSSEVLIPKRITLSFYGNSLRRRLADEPPVINSLPKHDERSRCSLKRAFFSQPPSWPRSVRTSPSDFALASSRPQRLWHCHIAAATSSGPLEAGVKPTAQHTSSTAWPVP